MEVFLIIKRKKCALYRCECPGECDESASHMQIVTDEWGNEYEECHFMSFYKKKICRESKSIEINILNEFDPTGYVKIGNKKYDAYDIEFLKVDYKDGKGWVTEFGEEPEES